MAVKSYRDLQVWQRSYAMALRIYKSTLGFPAQETYGLTSQLRRAAVSIPSNLAEGHARGQTADYMRFVRISRGSLAEVQTQLMLARDLGYMRAEDYDSLASECIELEQMLSGLIRSLTEKH